MKFRKSLLLTAACAIQGLMVTAASADTTTCADRGQVVNALSERFGEALTGNAVSATGNVLEVYSNTANQTWTILVTLPDRGLSCLVASGTGDHHLATQLAELTG
ncbi:MAG: hypothetical protein AAGA70_16870 [Pseudomonadota bacterium]